MDLKEGVPCWEIIWDKYYKEKRVCIKSWPIVEEFMDKWIGKHQISGEIMSKLCMEALTKSLRTCEHEDSFGPRF